jgi:hypothetical protein
LAVVSINIRIEADTSDGIGFTIDDEESVVVVVATFTPSAITAATKATMKKTKNIRDGLHC